MLNENETIIRPQRLKKAQKAFLQDYLQDSQDKFMESMEELRLGNPKRWLELYVDMTKLVVPKQSNVNVNVGINKDFRDLHLLATTKIGHKRLEGGELALERMEPVEDVDFEEIPIKNDNEESQSALELNGSI